MRYLCTECGAEFSSEECGEDPRDLGCPECGSMDLDEEMNQ